MKLLRAHRTVASVTVLDTGCCSPEKVLCCARTLLRCSISTCTLRHKSRSERMFSALRLSSLCWSSFLLFFLHWSYCSWFLLLFLPPWVVLHFDSSLQYSGMHCFVFSPDFHLLSTAISISRVLWHLNFVCCIYVSSASRMLKISTLPPCRRNPEGFSFWKCVFFPFLTSYLGDGDTYHFQILYIQSHLHLLATHKISALYHHSFWRYRPKTLPGAVFIFPGRGFLLSGRGLSQFSGVA